MNQKYTAQLVQSDYQMNESY